MRIERVDEDIATIYFVDSKDNAIQIPNGIVVRNLITNINATPQHNVEYLITWISNYVIFYNGEEAA
nr:1462_t:CDS:2 [Entrophospora candida]